MENGPIGCGGIVGEMLMYQSELCKNFVEPEFPKLVDTCPVCGSELTKPESKRGFGRKLVTRVDRGNQPYWSLDFECGACVETPANPDDVRRLHA
jgi:hypothetical protein